MNSEAFLKFFLELVGIFYETKMALESVHLPINRAVRLQTYVVDGHQSAVRPADLTASVLEALESLRRGHLVNKMPVCNMGVR